MSYTFERISESRLKDLVILFRDAFRWKTNEKFLRFRYDTTLLGPRDLGFVAYSEDRTPAAYYGVFAAKLSINGKVIQGAQSGDTATHSQHRGKGLFTDLAKVTYELAAKEGVDIVFGFPNKNSYPGFIKKLNWKHTHDVEVFKLRVVTLPLAELARKFKSLKPLFLFWVRIMLAGKKQGTLLPSSITSRNQDGVIHDENYFAYKQSLDKFLVKKNGSLFWLKLDGFLWVGDMSFSDQEKFDADLRWLRRLARFTGCDKVVFHCSPGTKMHDMVSRNHKKTTEMPAGGLDLRQDAGIDSLKFIGSDYDSW